jgi:hypothetical protein
VPAHLREILPFVAGAQWAYRVAAGLVAVSVVLMVSAPASAPDETSMSDSVRAEAEAAGA